MSLAPWKRTDDLVRLAEPEDEPILRHELFILL